VDIGKGSGSGLNGHLRALLRIRRNPAVLTVVAEHRDRLMRVGFEEVEAALWAQGRALTVSEPEGKTDAIVRDLRHVLVSLFPCVFGKVSDLKTPHRPLTHSATFL
jgi:predicted site-specific integrase-resolvase